MILVMQITTTWCATEFKGKLPRIRDYLGF